MKTRVLFHLLVVVGLTSCVQHEVEPRKQCGASSLTALSLIKEVRAEIREVSMIADPEEQMKRAAAQPSFFERYAKLSKREQSLYLVYILSYPVLDGESAVHADRVARSYKMKHPDANFRHKVESMDSQMVAAMIRESGGSRTLLFKRIERLEKDGYL